MTTLPQNARPTTALLGTKLGITQVWDEVGRLVPVTVVQVGTNVVTQVRTEATDGYSAVQLAHGQIDPRKVTQPRKRHFEKAGVTPRRHLAEIRTPDAGQYALGQEIAAVKASVPPTVHTATTASPVRSATLRRRRGSSRV